MDATNKRLLTVSPNVKAIRELTSQDRTVLSAVKVSPQAIFLQMAARRGEERPNLEGSSTRR